MKLKSVTSAMLTLSLLGCGGSSMEGATEIVEDQTNSVDELVDSITPSEPIIASCSMEINDAIKLMGDSYEFSSSENEGIQHHDYSWREGDKSWRFYFTWGGPYKGCEDTYFTTFRNTNFVPSDNICTAEIQGILDNYGGQVKQFDSFLHDKAIEFTYSWFDDGFYYKFENVFGRASCDVTLGYY